MRGRGFKKQIFRKSNINLGFASSSIATEHYLEHSFGRLVLIGRPLFLCGFQAYAVQVSGWCVGDTHSYVPHTQCGGERVGPTHGVSETRYRKRGVPL